MTGKGRGRRQSGNALSPHWARSLRVSRRTLLRDSAAGLPGAIGSVPDGMAASLLAGVSPIHGLYASMAGPVAGGLFASTSRVVVTTTSAAALAAGSALSGVAAAQRTTALFLLTALAGVFMVLAAAARLGRFTHFVSYSVMTGFLTGIAVNIILGQLPDATGVTAKGGLAVQKALRVLTHPGQVSVAALCVTLATIALMLLLGKSPARVAAAPAALALPSAVVYLAGLHVAVVSAGGPIPRGLPAPHVPDPAGSERAAVIIRLRGRTTLTATAVDVLTDYAARLRDARGRLYLSGVEPGMAERIRRSGLAGPDGPVEVVELTGILGESSLDAFQRASRWIDEPR